MSPTGKRTQFAKQFRIIDRQHLPGWSLDFDGEVRKVGGKRTEKWRPCLCLRQVYGPRRLLGIAEAGPVEQHRASVAAGEKRKASRRSRALEGIEAIAIDPREPDEYLGYFFASHALDGVAPDALDLADEVHPTPFLCFRPRGVFGGHRAWGRGRCQSR